MNYKTFTVAAMLALSASCTQDPNKSGATSLPPLAGAINTISEGVQAAGNGMELSQEVSALTASHAGVLSVTPMESSLCTSHGEPAGPGGVGYLSTSDPKYPFIHTYCSMTVTDGDTVSGGFELAKSLICSLERGGIEFNNVLQTIPVNFSDTVCWPHGGPDGAGSSITFQATGSAPASFNSHFDKGVIFTVSQLGLTFKIAANLSATNVEFIAHESWTDGNIGVMAGSLNKSTGVLHFEKRDERINSTCGDSSCGWNRHSRIRAQLTMSSSAQPLGLSDLSYSYLDVHDAVVSPSTPANGKLITAQGNLSTGIKARIFGANDTTLTPIEDASNWTEESGATGCLTRAGYDSTNCTSETGINKFTGNPAPFTLLGTHSSPDAWLSAFSGFTFSIVDVNND